MPGPRSAGLEPVSGRASRRRTVTIGVNLTVHWRRRTRKNCSTAEPLPVPWPTC